MNAPHKSARAALIKLADKVSNLRAMVASPPADWDFQRRKEYFDWAVEVVNGLPSANPVLKTEFEKAVKAFGETVQP